MWSRSIFGYSPMLGICCYPLQPPCLLISTIHDSADYALHVFYKFQSQKIPYPTATNMLAKESGCERHIIGGFLNTVLRLRHSNQIRLSDLDEPSGLMIEYKYEQIKMVFLRYMK